MAATAASEAVRGMQAPPPVRDQDAQTTEDGLAELRSWLAAVLPVLRQRAKLLADWHDEVSGATDQLYPELIQYAGVIAATCTGAASRPEISGVDFDMAIVDEAGQVGVADVLVPLVRARRAVLVGDHRQLPPFLDSEVEQWGKVVGDQVTRDLMAKSALELLAGELPASHVTWLTRQRRMPAVIGNFVSTSFYERPAAHMCGARTPGPGVPQASGIGRHGRAAVRAAAGDVRPGARTLGAAWVHESGRGIAAHVPGRALPGARGGLGGHRAVPGPGQADRF